MKTEQREDMVFDTGVFVELLAGTGIGKKAYQLLKSGSTGAVVSELNITELSYIICRKKGWKKATETVERLSSTGYVKTIPVGRLIEPASRIKCERSISLVDCFTLALGELLGLTVLFAKHERELDRELARRPFSANITFLEDLR